MAQEGIGLPADIGEPLLVLPGGLIQGEVFQPNLEGEASLV